MKSFQYPPTIFVYGFGEDKFFFMTTKPVRMFLSKDQDPTGETHYELQKNEWFFRCDSCQSNRGFVVAKGENDLTEHDFDFLISSLLYYTNEPWLIKVPLQNVWTCL